MQNTELLMHLAEIAGVFVGFGALISIRSEAIRDEEVMMIRAIVLYGIMVVITAIFPVVISGFGVAGDGLWTMSAWVFLALWWASSILNRWDFERSRVLAAITGRTRMRMEAPAVPIWLSMNGALVLILTGRLPESEPALYLAAVALNLLLTAQMLIYLVYLQRSSRPVGNAAPRTEADPPVRDREPQSIAEL